MAIVHLPRSLVALIPGMPHTMELSGTDLGQVILALDAAHPGVLDRLCEPGPRIRPFLNLFVDGSRADLGTPVRPTSVIHVVPAVAGG